MSSRRYILTDWTAAGISSLSMLLAYRASESNSALGDVGWLLGLITASLFISAATQYYSMFLQSGVWKTYIAFLPVLFIESIFLLVLTDLPTSALISSSLAANVFFASFKGDLMGRGKFQEAAWWNVYEQLLRLLSLLFLLQRGTDPGRSLLLSMAAAYLLSAITAFAVGVSGERRITLGVCSPKEFAELFKQAAWYALVHAGIYLVANADILALRQSQGIWEFALLKPYGQLLFVAAIPFINIYLYRLKENKKDAQKILYVLLAIFLGYELIATVLLDYLNSCIFGKHYYNQLGVFVVILEHVFMALVTAMLYRCLMQCRGKGFMVVKVILSCLLPVLVLPLIATSNGVYIGYALCYITVFWLNRSLLATTVTGVHG